MSDQRRVSLHVLDSRDLDRQVDRGAQYHYRMHESALDRIHDLAIFVRATLELLVAKKLITQAEIATYVGAARQMLAEHRWTDENGFEVSRDVRDKYATPGALIDCETRVHLCRSVCCSLEHPLQPSDLEEGVVKWDLGHPYAIRHEQDNLCTHLERGDGSCQIFEHRPLTCRVYSCKGDERVWRDFDNRIPNHEAIEAILARRHVRTTRMDGAPSVPVTPKPGPGDET